MFLIWMLAVPTAADFIKKDSFQFYHYNIFRILTLQKLSHWSFESVTQLHSMVHEGTSNYF